ncbi:hypothetical protein FB45DRAFT_780977 [Roridomyces roridus]|uniref:F-box domain-containing protein n=1 Tax=Roridomyces roridus TaxID=1738132 RepID=A0AAD7CDX5_9AGAR|nr:hypothetical protein FB45DRAFT_780977 [Roridomyces roridus]
MVTLLSLPPEISSIICEHVDTSLAPLCRISHSFRDQAQRIMYRSVDLRDCSMRLVKSWCLAVARNQHLADRIWALILQLPSTLEPKEAELLSRAFARCVNLKRLAVHHMPGSTPETNKQSWILEGPFHLERLFNTYFSLGNGTFAFFDQQTDIRVLSLPWAVPNTTFGDLQLPNLIALDAPLDVVCRLAEAKTGRPLERIQIHQDRLAYVLSSMSRFASTLKTFTIVREGRIIGSGTIGVVDQVLKVFPHLQHFGICEKEPQEVSLVEDSLLDRLQQFTSLITLTLHLCRWVSDFSEAMGFRSIENCTKIHELGSSILTTCATLRKATIAVKLQVAVGDEEERIACTCTKESDGSISAIFEDELEEDSFYTTIFD